MLFKWQCHALWKSNMVLVSVLLDHEVNIHEIARLDFTCFIVYVCLICLKKSALLVLTPQGHTMIYLCVRVMPGHKKPFVYGCNVSYTPYFITVSGWFYSCHFKCHFVADNCTNKQNCTYTWHFIYIYFFTFWHPSKPVQFTWYNSWSIWSYCIIPSSNSPTLLIKDWTKHYWNNN